MQLNEIPIEKVEGRPIAAMEGKQPKTLHPLKLANGEVTYERTSLQVVSVTSGHLAAPAPRSHTSPVQP